MAAIIKMYTWWTIRRHKKEPAYKLVAISRKTAVSGSGKLDGDALELVTVSDATAWKKMKDGAVVFGLLPQAFARDFEFREIANDNVPGSLAAEMHGVFSLNFDDPDGLGAFLFYLPDLCRDTKVKNEWDEQEIGALLANCGDAVRNGLQNAVKTQTAHDLITLGDSGLGDGRPGTPSDKYYREFPQWVKVQKLHTKFTYSETGEKAEAEDAPKSEPTEAEKWEKLYNEKVEALERKQLEDALKNAVDTQALGARVKEQQLILASLEAERNFWRAKHVELAEISDIFTVLRKKTWAAYARMLYFLADHPILSPIILLAVLLVYNYVVTEYVPLRVSIRISGDSSAAESMKEALREHFENARNDGVRVYLTFSNSQGGYVTGEFLLREKEIRNFEASLDRFIKTHRSFVDKRYSGEAASSFLDGGINFILKKKVYTIPVKTDEAAMEVKILLRGENSIGGELQTFLMNEYAVDGKVSRNGNTFTFKLPHGTTIDKLKSGLHQKFSGVEISGNRQIIIDATQAAATEIFLNVKNLSPAQKAVVGRIFNITILGENRVAVISDRRVIGEKIETARATLSEAGIGGEWDEKESNTYVFSRALFTYTVYGGARGPEVVKALERSGAFARVIESRIGAKQGPKYPYSMTVRSYIPTAGELREELKKSFPDSDNILIEIK